MEECDITQAQELVNSLQVLQIVVPAMHSSLHPQVTRPIYSYYVDSRNMRNFCCDVFLAH